MRAWKRLAVVVALMGLALCQPLLAAYTDPKGRFSIEPPAGWQTKAEAGGSRVTFSAGDGVATLQVIAGTVAETATLEQLAAATEQQMLKDKRAGGAKRLTEKRTKVAGLPAIQRQYRMVPNRGVTVRTSVTFVKSGRLWVSLVATALDAQFPQLEPAFQHSIASLRLGASPATRPDPERQKKLQALEAARRMGLITAQDYAKRKAELEGKPTTPPRTPPPVRTLDAPVVRKKLQALEEAYEADAIPQDEYKRKKAALEAQLRGPRPLEPSRPVQPQLDEATRKKLRILEAARGVGILTREEYDRKKAEILRQARGAPRPPARTRRREEE